MDVTIGQELFILRIDVWEHDETFKEYLKKTRAMAVDMETATLFSCGFAKHIPTGALLLVSDQPMTPDGVKTDKSDSLVTKIMWKNMWK